MEESCVRLFVSVDLVGSTAFKDTQDAKTDIEKRHSVGPPWAHFFSNFYSGFPKYFERSFGPLTLPVSRRPKLVKTIGDEILLQSEIRSSWEAQEIVTFLAQAMVEYKERDLKTEPLLLKGAAWIAGFPINNHCVRLEEEGGRTGVEDYIGPSIDTGFRIAKLATPTKLIVSVDLALLLLTGARPLELYYDGAETHKGVLKGRPYPVIWHKVKGADSALHDAELALRDHRPKQPQLLEYCGAYVASSASTWLIRPYLADDPDFKEMPNWHRQVLDTMRQVDERNQSTGPDEATGSGQPPAA